MAINEDPKFAQSPGEAYAQQAKLREEIAKQIAEQLVPQLQKHIEESVGLGAAIADLADDFDINDPEYQKQVRDRVLRSLTQSLQQQLRAGGSPGVVKAYRGARPLERAAPAAVATEPDTGNVDLEPPPPKPPAEDPDVNPPDPDRPQPQAAVPTKVQLGRTNEGPTSDIYLWRVIRDRTKALSFENYAAHIDRVLCAAEVSTRQPSDYGADVDELRDKLTSLQGIRGRDAYKLLKLATEAFLMQEAGLLSHGVVEAALQGTDKTMVLDPDRLDRADLGALQLLRSTYLDKLSAELPDILPYFTRIKAGLSGVPIKKIGALALGSEDCYGIIPSRVASPCMIELIWSYWHEEAGVIQALKAVALRFQNRRSPKLRNPLEHMAIDPLRPLNNLLWGFIEEESSRLTLSRRAHEYDHQYGLTIQGKAVPGIHSVDSRSKFLESFHTLLHLCSRFFREDDDATIYADGFPLLNSLKEVHLLLAQGAHNQYGDLPWTSRAEILIQHWLLARPEMREFLASRVMVPYQEPWMGRLETMRELQGWGKAPVNHFRDLAIYGEQILLSIRFGNWTDVTGRASAVNWAKFWRDEIQTYTHAYRSLTGVDLTSDHIDFSPPARLLAKTEKRSNAN